ncbi:hypothetical protein IWX47DRAFT_400578 [Phyllosticta citricarpa]|uniref:Secreted protein n=1 Tax=Phyllosticta citricarpa TaxID=55181 RepID=A0ABR1MF02_9PEZI
MFLFLHAYSFSQARHGTALHCTAWLRNANETAHGRSVPLPRPESTAPPQSVDDITANISSRRKDLHLICTAGRPRWNRHCVCLSVVVQGGTVTASVCPWSSKVEPSLRLSVRPSVRRSLRSPLSKCPRCARSPCDTSDCQNHTFSPLPAAAPRVVSFSHGAPHHHDGTCCGASMSTRGARGRLLPSNFPRLVLTYIWHIPQTTPKKRTWPPKLEPAPCRAFRTQAARRPGIVCHFCIYFDPYRSSSHVSLVLRGPGPSDCGPLMLLILPLESEPLHCMVADSRCCFFQLCVVK